MHPKQRRPLLRELPRVPRLIESNRDLALALGDNGRAYYRTHYDWPVIERKYLDMLDRLQAADRSGQEPAGFEPLPGWFARRRANLPPANEVVKALPSGPALDKESRT